MVSGWKRVPTYAILTGESPPFFCMLLKKVCVGFFDFLCGSLSFTCRSYLPRPPLIIPPLFFFPPTFPAAIGNANPRIYIRQRQVNELYTKASFHARPFSSLFFRRDEGERGCFQRIQKYMCICGWMIDTAIFLLGRFHLNCKATQKKRGFAIRENCVGVSARIKPNYADEIRSSRFPSG